MNTAKLMAIAKTHPPKFTTVEEFQAFHAQESAKDNARLNKERQEARAKRLFDRACVPMLHQSCSFDNYVTANIGQQRAKKISQYFVDNFDQQLEVGRCMIFYGETGTGKNHLASAMANQLLVSGYSVLVIKVSDLMSKFRSCYNRDSAMSEERLSRELVNVDFLVLDEVGVSHGSNDEVVQINRLIDNRVNNFKPTVVLTNLDLKALEGNLGARNIDRLLANKGAAIEFKWESFRRRGAA